MTETALLPAPAGFEESSSDGNRRVLLMAAGAGVLALLVAAYFLFMTGGSSSQPMGLSQLPKPRVHTVPKSATVAKPSTKVVPATFNGVHSKDPFKPLVAPAPAVAPAGSTGTTGSTGSTGTTTGTTGAAPAQVVTLKGVGTSAVTVSVNNVSYTPKVGGMFATFFKLLKLQGSSCATFLYGDASFDLCKGSTVTLQ